jgi:hypothetical protein
MGKTKGAAPAAPKKTRARKKAPAKKEIKVPEHLLVPVEPGEWPSNLSNEDAERLFEHIENGGLLKEGAELIGVTRSAISQWKKRHGKFAVRMAEAEEIGAYASIEDIAEYAKSIHDRDGAAAAREKRKNMMERLRARFPKLFKTSPFNPAAIQVNVGINFEQELLAARQRAFAERGLTITVDPNERTGNR